MRVLLVENPSARRGRAARHAALIRTRLSDAGISWQGLQADSADEVSRRLERQDLADYDAVVACGGDGTLFRVVNGLVRNSRRLPMAVIPTGTGNAFARDLGLGAGEVDKAVALIRRGRSRAIDLGEVRCAETHYYFINIIGAGLVTETGQTAHRLKFLGKASYSVAALLQILLLKKRRFQMEIDGESLDRELIFFELSNSRYTGTRFLIAPGARLDDGLLDLTLLSGTGRARLLRLFPSIYRGAHVEFPEIETRQVSHIRIAAPENLLLMPDGEFIGRTPVEIRCAPGALDLIC